MWLMSPSAGAALAAALAFVASTYASPVAAPRVAARAAACNGNAALCSRRYSDVSLVGSHDSAFVGVGLVDNQHASVADQLAAGVRFLQAQTHLLGSTIELCHTSCLEEDAGSLNAYLATVATWLAANPAQVLTLLLTNGDAVPVATFAAAFAAAGLDTFAFTPVGQLAPDEWPTLQEMIDDGTRLVVFMDYHADTSSVSYILDEFSYYFETPYDTTDASFPECTIDRPSGASATGRMSIVNHFLDIDILGILIPNQLAASSTNSNSSIMAQAGLCKSSYGRWPNVVLLDWIDEGSPFDAQNALNGL